MQQAAQFSNDVVIEFFKTGIPGLALLIGAFGTFLGTLLSAWKGFANARINRRIERNVDGRFSEMIKLINALSTRADEADRRAASDKRTLTTALSIIAARTGHPFTTVEALIRAEDLGLPPRRPPSASPRRRRNSGEMPT